MPFKNPTCVSVIVISCAVPLPIVINPLLVNSSSLSTWISFASIVSILKKSPSILSALRVLVVKSVRSKLVSPLIVPLVNVLIPVLLMLYRYYIY